MNMSPLGDLTRKERRELGRLLENKDRAGLQAFKLKKQNEQMLQENKPQSNLMFGLGKFAGDLIKTAYQDHREASKDYRHEAFRSTQRMSDQSAGIAGSMAASNAGSVAAMLGTLYQPLPVGGGGMGMGMMGMGMPGMMGMGGMGMPNMTVPLGMGMGGMGVTPLPNMMSGMGGGNPAFEQKVAMMFDEQQQGMAKLFEMIQQKTNAGGTENNDTIKPELQFGGYLMPPKIGEKIENWDKQYYADGASLDDKFKIRDNLKKYLTQHQSAINAYNNDGFTLALDKDSIEDLVDTVLPTSELYPYNELKPIIENEFKRKEFIKHVDKPAINDVIDVITKAGGNEDATLKGIISSNNPNVPQYIKNLGQAISKDQLEVLMGMTLKQLRDSRDFASEQKPNEVKGYDGNPITGLDSVTSSGDQNKIIDGKFFISEFPSQNFMSVLDRTNSTDPDKITVEFKNVNVSESALLSTAEDSKDNIITLQYNGLPSKKIILSEVYNNTLSQSQAVGNMPKTKTPLQTAATGLLNSVKKLHELLKQDDKSTNAIKEATVNLKNEYGAYAVAVAAAPAAV